MTDLSHLVPMTWLLAKIFWGNQVSYLISMKRLSLVIQTLSSWRTEALWIYKTYLTANAPPTLVDTFSRSTKVLHAEYEAAILESHLVFKATHFQYQRLETSSSPWKSLPLQQHWIEIWGIITPNQTRYQCPKAMYSDIHPLGKI